MEYVTFACPINETSSFIAEYHLFFSITSFSCLYIWPKDTCKRCNIKHIIWSFSLCLYPEHISCYWSELICGTFVIYRPNICPSLPSTNDFSMDQFIDYQTANLDLGRVQYLQVFLFSLVTHTKIDTKQYLV